MSWTDGYGITWSRPDVEPTEEELEVERELEIERTCRALTPPRRHGRKIPGRSGPIITIMVSTIGRTRVEALRALLLQPAEGAPARMLINGATCAVISGSENTLRACINWDGRMAGLRELGENISALRQPGFDPTAAIWDLPPPIAQRGTRIKNSTPSEGSRAQHEPPSRGTDRSSEIVDVTVEASQFSGAELLKPFKCRLHVPGWMENRPWVNAAGHALRWMFTCSYGGAQKVTVRLNRERAMAPLERTKYVQVLVLRPRKADPAAFDAYLRCWGSMYIIVEMPPTMHVRYAGDATPRELKVEVGRIGYARPVCQLLAHHLGLNEIWMLDDNVERCWAIEVDPDSTAPHPGEDGVVKLRECGFATVMRGMELLLDRGDKGNVNVQLPLERITFDAVRERGKLPLRHTLADSDSALVKGGQRAPPGEQLSSLRQYSGGGHAYGILGMQRHDPRNWARQQHGFLATHSVYSFFLLNVKATLGKGVLYPAKAIWEASPPAHRPP